MLTFFKFARAMIRLRRMQRLWSTARLLLVVLVPLATPHSVQGGNLDAEVKNLTWVGFQQFQDATRVFVRTTEKAQYKVDSSREKMVVLILENIRIPLYNNQRVLDTHYFDGPVVSVVAKPIEGASPSVNVEIRLRRKVAFSTQQTDGVVALDFRRE